MSDSLHLACIQCNAVNKLPLDKAPEAAKCGRCKAPLWSGQAGQLTDSNYNAQLNWTELPVVVDCWASWCGPCKQFAPVFEQTAKKLEPKARFLKLDTQAEQTLAGRFNIQSIPTLLVFKKGQEVARQAGAMSPAQFEAWLMPHLD